MSNVALNPQFTASRPQFKANTKQNVPDYIPSLQSNDVAELNKAVEETVEENPGLKEKISGKLSSAKDSIKGVPTRIKSSALNRMMNKAQDMLKKVPESKLMEGYQKFQKADPAEMAKNMIDTINNNPKLSKLSRLIPSEEKLTKMLEKSQSMMKKLGPEGMLKLMDKIKTSKAEKPSFSGKKVGFKGEGDAEVAAAIGLFAAAVVCGIAAVALSVPALAVAGIVLFVASVSK